MASGSEGMKTILSVDDSASVRQMVKLALGSAGYAVVEAGDGLQGLEKAKSHSIALVFTDLNMPRMDGLEFIRSVRLLQSCRGVPIVFLTTESDQSMKQKAKAAGATGWITKPFTREQLVAITKKLLG
jgi:two-component system chemotaxis response regulator CheY